MRKYGNWLLSLITVLGFLVYNEISVQAEEVVESINLQGNHTETVISEPMSAEEIISFYMENENVSFVEAKQALFPSDEYSITPYNYNIVPYAIQYRYFSQRVSPTGSVYFYCETDEAKPSFRAIRKIMNGGYNSGNKIYEGTLYYNLANSNRIDFILNGHLYHSGTLGISGGGSVSIGGAATLSFNLSHKGNYYKPVHVFSNIYY